MNDVVLQRALRHELARQDGVVAWHQLAGAGAGRHDVRRWERRRLLTPVHSGVWVDHTGVLTPRQRDWAAVLACGRAALHRESALALPSDVVHVAIDASRRMADPTGVQVHRTKNLDSLVRWAASPPRVLTEVAVVELVHRAATDTDVVRLLTDAVGSRTTTVARLRREVDRRSRLSGRAFVMRVLGDLDLGACSVLEQRYLAKVERAHGLPRSRRQVRRRGVTGAEYRDLEHEPWGVVVELDGQQGHAGWVAQARDADRDLDDLAAGRVVVRLRWRQVDGTPCRTAGRVGTLLTARGWPGPLRRCSSTCEAVSS